MNKVLPLLIILAAIYISISLMKEQKVLVDKEDGSVLQDILSPEDEKHEHEDEDDHHHDDEDTHYHSGFRVVVDGQLQNYDDGDFMHFSPCGIAPSKSLEDPFERIHLHNYLGDVAHVHAEAVTWREFFIGLEMNNLLEREDVTVYIKGEESEEGLDTIAGEYDSVLITFGNTEEIDINDQKYWTSKERVIEGESGVENCGSDS